MCFNVSFCAFFEDDKEDEAHDEEDDEEDEADDEDDEDEEGLSSGFALVGHAFLVRFHLYFSSVFPLHECPDMSLRSSLGG